MTSLVAHKGFDMRTIKDDWNSGRLQEQIDEMMLLKKKFKGWAYNTEMGGGQWEYGTMDIHAACFITGGEEAFKRWIGNKTGDEAMNQALQYLSDRDVSLFYYSGPFLRYSSPFSLDTSTQMETMGSVKKRLAEIGRQKDEYEQWVAERSTTHDFQQWRADRAQRRKREREDLDERAQKVTAVQSV
ncbi:unnamed protein product [Vitrella brassicaformis CCMP3155]|uniref:Uncharacterized protein n=1 Tax=Vitrella brassicaformis (strain CCMP3155) TaxID=1169540 RepID=A0A0G4FHI5_VITBC|nr:unnamed protein product [Vitrella brassicaformis CCMP3155]|eukprot:CEM12918.1 unnamed protein product [Vitrella brassicaformis CCMP3155]